MQQDQLKGKLERLVEELRVHGGNGLSVYGRRLRSEIASTEAEIDAQAFQEYARQEQESRHQREQRNLRLQKGSV